MSAGAPMAKVSLPVVPGAEHLRFRCTVCGDCCRRIRVALTHLDLARLTRALSVPEASLVGWLTPDSVDLSAVQNGLVELSAGPRLMVLAHAGGACQFLGADNRCQVYAARPLDCRLYPFVLEHGAGQVTRVSLFDAVGCGELGDEADDLDALAQLDQQRWAEVAEYYALVARWNTLARHRRRMRHRVGAATDFLEFISG